MRRLKSLWISLTYRKDKQCIPRNVMEWWVTISFGKLLGRPRETCRVTLAPESKLIDRSWNELNALAGRVERYALLTS